MKTVKHAIRAVLSCPVLVTAAHMAAAQTLSAPRLLELLRNASALAFVDPASGAVLGRVAVVTDRHEVGYARRRTAFVASPREGISMIDIALYFTAEGFKTIGRYDPAANKVEWMLGIGQDGTHMMVLARDQQTMWVPNRGSDSVSVIEGVAGGPPKFRTAAIPVPGKTPEGISGSGTMTASWSST
jgi:hypothetical protein